MGLQSFVTVSFLPDLFSSETLLGLQLSCSLEFFDLQLQAWDLISFQMVPMGSKTPMQQVLRLRMLEGDGNDLLAFFQLKDVCEQPADEGLSNTTSSIGCCIDGVGVWLYKILTRHRVSPSCYFRNSRQLLLAERKRRAWVEKELSPGSSRSVSSTFGHAKPCSVLLSRLPTALISFKWNRVLSTMEDQALHLFKVIFRVSYLFAKQGNVSWKNLILLTQSFRQTHLGNACSSTQ